jgi:hypothetical protein
MQAALALTNRPVQGNHEPKHAMEEQRVPALPLILMGLSSPEDPILITLAGTGSHWLMQAQNIHESCFPFLRAAGIEPSELLSQITR